MFHKDKACHAQVFITCKGDKEKRMHFVVTRSLNVCLTVRCSVQYADSFCLVLHVKLLSCLSPPPPPPTLFLITL